MVHITTVPASLLFLEGQPGYMRERGFETVVISSPGEKLDEFGREQGVPVAGIEMPRRITPMVDLVSLFRLWRKLEELSPDIVHAHTPKGGLLGMIAAAAAGVPARIYHMRGLPLMTAVGVRRALLTTTERLACLLATEVLCGSHSLREVVLELGLCSSERIRVLGAGSGQGVEARDRFHPGEGTEDRRRIREELGIPRDAIVFGFVGRIVRDKGIAELTEAWRAMRVEDPNAHLMVVGVPEPRDPVPPPILAALEGDERVHFLGFRDDTPALYRAMDVVVLPTYREGFPNVALEAAATGLPVVATRVAGCVDAVADGQTGTLVPPGDASSLLVALLDYARNEDLRAAHGSAGRERVLAEFDRQRLWREIARTYERAVERVRA